MDYGRLPFNTEQALYDRIALLEWVERSGELDKGDILELRNLRQMAETSAEKRAKLSLKIV